MARERKAKRRAWLAGAVVSVWLGTMLSPAHAVIYTLEDGNSTAGFEVDASNGQFSWLIDGSEHIAQQWFWYRTAAMNAEAPINALNRIGAFTSDTNPFSDPRQDSLGVLYRNGANTLEIETLFTLRGGVTNSRTADILEGITLRNKSASPLTISFFQYADFDLDNSGGQDMVTFLNDNTVRQVSGNFSVTETVVLPLPTHHQASLVPVILNSLNDGAPTVLSDNAGPVGPGNVAWAFQWDFVIAPNSSVIISKDKQITPEPASLALLLGGLLLGLRRRW